jgi:hypothetical protein
MSFQGVVDAHLFDDRSAVFREPIEDWRTRHAPTWGKFMTSLTTLDDRDAGVVILLIGISTTSH